LIKWQAWQKDDESMKRRKSPCVDVCQFTGPRGWCLGCGRTRQECDQWKTMKPYARKILEKDLKKRMSRITAERG
jgi:predicted Fe-S protein YdhL (DUF1289 family)